MNNKVLKYKLHTNIDCAHCASVIEEKINALPEIKNFSISVLTKQVIAEIMPNTSWPKVLTKIQTIAEDIEPGTTIVENNHDGATKNTKYKLQTNIECAHCASVIEEQVNALSTISNFSISVLTKQVHAEILPTANWQEVLKEIQAIAEKVEPGTLIWADNTDKSREYIYYTNLNCAHCAGMIEDAINQLPEVEQASITLATKQLRFTLKEDADLNSALKTMEELAEKIEPGTIITKSRKAKAEVKESFIEKFHNKFHSFELIIGGILFIILSFTNWIPKQWELNTYVIAYLILGIHVFKNAFNNIKRMRISDESLLMTIATGGAFIIGEHPEAIGVMLFYRIGQAFEVFATNRSRKQIISTVDMRPETIHLLNNNGEIQVIPAENVNIDDLIIVKPGERIPVDGIVVSGDSRIDTSPITGESVPVKTHLNQEILSGCINLISPLTIKVTHDLNNSMVSRILDSVENAAANKPQVQRLISRFATIYTPFVVGIAVLTAVIPSLFTGNWEYWIYAALTFLVISCPCALVLSVPLSFFSGIGVASQYGILFKGGISIEALQKVKAVAFDKTGTLTKGVFTINEIRSQANFTEAEIIKLCASSEQSSTHPIAQSILSYAENKNISLIKPNSIKEISGEGIVATVDDKQVLCGNLRLMDRYALNLPSEDRDITDTVVYVSIANKYAGAVIIGDEIKEDAPEAITKLQKLGLQTAIFTGDNVNTAEKVGKTLGINKIFAKLLPEDKLSKLEELRRTSGKVLFVGDGINDAPILAGADVSAAMGSGADAAIEAADIVFMNSRLQAVTNAFAIAKDTLSIAWQNVVFALGIKALIMLIGLAGYASMWAAVFADSGVTLICVLNALRLFGKKYAK